MRFQEIQSKLVRKGWPTLLGWLAIASILIIYYGLKQLAAHNRTERQIARETSNLGSTSTASNQVRNTSASFDYPGGNLPPSSSPQQSNATAPVQAPRPYNQPSFGNLNTSNRILSDDFLPKGTILYTTLTSDIVSNNQVSPATATLIFPAIFAHRMRIPVGTKITGKIAPGNLRGRVFVSWDTLVFCEEGRQGWELPIKGVGMTYEQNPHSDRWIINGAGLKGYVFDDSQANAFKLAALRAMQDFTKTLQTLTLQQATVVSGAGTVTTTTAQTPEATIQNSGLAAAESFIGVIAARYAATLQQQNSYVLVPTSRLCAIFLEETIDIATAAPGRSIQTQR